jgi:hypothetical protein
VEGVSPLWNPQKICATGAVPVDKGNMFTTVLGAPYPLKYHGYTHETHPNCTPNRSFPALKWNMTTKQPWDVHSAVTKQLYSLNDTPNSLTLTIHIIYILYTLW